MIWKNLCQNHSSRISRYLYRNEMKDTSGNILIVRFVDKEVKIQERLSCVVKTDAETLFTSWKDTLRLETYDNAT